MVIFSETNVIEHETGIAKLIRGNFELSLDLLKEVNPNTPEWDMAMMTIHSYATWWIGRNICQK
jgi:hypothetical protein